MIACVKVSTSGVPKPMSEATPSKTPTKHTNTPSTPRTPSVRRRREDNDSEEDTPRKKKEKFWNDVLARSNKDLEGKIKESSGEAKPALSSEMKGRGGQYMPNCVSKEEKHPNIVMLRDFSNHLSMGEDVGEARGGQSREDESHNEFGPTWTDANSEAPHSVLSDSTRATDDSLQNLCFYIFDTIFANL